MNSYEESVIESCWNVIGLWELSASDKAMGEAIDRMKALVEGGPDGFESKVQEAIDSLEEE